MFLSQLAQLTPTTTVSLVSVTLASNSKMDNVLLSILLYLPALTMLTLMESHALAMLDSIKPQPTDVLLALQELHGTETPVEPNLPELALLDTSSM